MSKADEDEDKSKLRGEEEEGGGRRERKWERKGVVKGREEGGKG